MTEKVKVSKEVAEAIEFLKKEFDYNFEAFMKVSLNDGWHINKNCTPLNKISVEDLAKILINGYEVELTPEEKIKKLFYGYAGENEFHESDAQKAILELLEILEKKVEGVNK